MAETLQPVVTMDVGSPMRQCRFAPMNLGGQRAFLVVHAGCAEDDPYHAMFFLPTDTLKLTAFDAAGRRMWQRDLGGGVIPGIWFCPVLVCDLDGDGCDEVWLVGNSDGDHPLNHERFVLERLAGTTGQTLSQTPWPRVDGNQSTSHTFRNFLQSGLDGGRRRLITAQGTYGPMQLQCLDDQLQPVWSRTIPAAEPGARGSHMFPVIDLDGDGRDELLWGERCIDIRDGHERWVADRDGWPGHSDIIQPTRLADGRWVVYTCRESWRDIPGGVVMYDGLGRELWGYREMGHVDMGWTARIGDGGEHACYALLIGQKTAGPGGFQRGGMTEYLFDMAGRPLPAQFPLYGTLPVDLDGDGRHELAYMTGQGQNPVLDRRGREIGRVQGAAIMGAKLLDRPGEQLVTWDESGIVRMYAWAAATDSPAAVQRYALPYYANSLKAAAVGYNRTNLGGV